jgi:hypothetical protein
VLFSANDAHNPATADVARRAGRNPQLCRQRLHNCAGSGLADEMEFLPRNHAGGRSRAAGLNHRRLAGLVAERDRADDGRLRWTLRMSRASSRTMIR